MNNKQKALKISLIALLCTLLISLIVYALIEINNINDSKILENQSNNINKQKEVDDLSLYSLEYSPVDPESMDTITKVLYKGNEIFRFESKGQYSFGYIMNKTGNNLYFVNQLGGLGGWILYGNIGDIYKLNLDTLSLEKIDESDYVYNNDFVFYGEKKEFNILYFKTGITKKFTSINLTAYQHGTYYISPKGENIAIPFSNVNPDPDVVGVGGIMLLNLNTGEAKEIYKEKNSVPHISDWKNENTPNIVVEVDYNSSDGKNTKETDFFYYDKTLSSVVLTKETESIEDYFTKKIEPFDYNWIENMAECRATTFPENEKAITDENKKTEWINFYDNLLKKFDKDDVVTTYTFTATEDGSKDEFSLYVLPNKLGYKTADDFEKDFSYDCGIGDGTFYASENYLLETFGCGGVDDGHKIQCSDMRDMVESSIKLK